MFHLKRTIHVSLVIATLASASAVQAATYWVAKTGSDGNSCVEAQSSSTPKLTINAGLGCLTANNGDTLIIRNGTYVEAIDNSIPTGNSWGNATTIKAENIRQAIIRPPSGNFALLITGTAKKYIVLDGLVLDGINQANNVVKLAGNTTVGFPDHIRLTNCEIKNGQAGSAILVATDGTAAPSLFGGFNEILNCLIHDNAPLPNDAGIYIQNADNLVEGNDIYNNSVGITNNKQNLGFPDRNKYRRNTIHNNTKPGAKGGGITITTNTDVEISNNLIYGNSGTLGNGINSDTNASVNTLIYNNTIYGNSGSGILLGSSSTSNIVRNNIVYGNGGGISISNPSNTVDHNTTANPAFVNAGAGNFSLQAGSSAIDAGVTVSEVNVDFAGVQRPKGAGYDIGAYEMVISSDQTPPLPPINLSVQ